MILLELANGMATAIPDPGTGTAPPGSEKLLLLLRWAAWIALGLCVLGVMLIGAMMALAYRRGEAGEAASKLGWVFAGAIVIGSASGFVALLV